MISDFFYPLFSVASPLLASYNNLTPVISGLYMLKKKFKNHQSFSSFSENIFASFLARPEQTDSISTFIPRKKINL
jgi:hypothetical protein